MTEFTRPATWEDVKHLARLLEEEGVEYALIGGYAIAAHGYVRFSEDVDILVNPSRDNTRRKNARQGPRRRSRVAGGTRQTSRWVGNARR